MPRQWQHDDPTAEHAVPRTERARQPTRHHFTVHYLQATLYEVVSSSGRSYEVAILADGSGEIVSPDRVSGQTKTAVLKAVQEYQDQNWQE